MRNDQDIGFQYFCLSIQTAQFVLINCVEDYIFSARVRSPFLDNGHRTYCYPSQQLAQACTVKICKLRRSILTFGRGLQKVQRAA